MVHESDLKRDATEVGPHGLTIRAATSDDVATIVAFNQRLAEESEGKRLDDAVITAGVRRALAAPALCRYLVAELDGRVIGQTMLTYEMTDWRDGLVYWIQSVYVHAEHRGRGVFRRLYAQVLAEAAAAGDVRLVRLYVEKDNAVAIQAYERLGMARARYHVYEVAVPSGAVL